MPTYEYACKDCGEHLDVVQKFTDDPVTTCPACAGTLRKVFGTIGISFKGSGFYKNDSRTGSGEKKKEPAASEGGSSDSKDTSPAPKADAPAAKNNGAKTDGAKNGTGKKETGSTTAAAS